LLFIASHRYGPFGAVIFSMEILTRLARHLYCIVVFIRSGANVRGATLVLLAVAFGSLSISVEASVAFEGHAAMVKSNGTVWAWGDNEEGQLGDGTTTSRVAPVPVTGLTGVIAVAVGKYHTVAVKGDGTVWAWGNNTYGQLGDGTTTGWLSPMPVTGLTNVTAIAAGDFFTLALRTDGTVWSWGANYTGQLGSGATIDRLTPGPVSGLSGIVRIAAGGDHALAVKNDGSVWSWGSNFKGQLGDGTNTERTVPVQVSGLATGVIAVAAGFGHSVALKSDGTLHAWGDNSSGQLGDGTMTERTTPVEVDFLAEVIAVSAGYSFTVALKNDGSAWSFGRNDVGQLGNGTTTDQISPVQVAGLSGATAITAVFSQTFAVKNDGTVWAWGRNSIGQLGDGLTTQRTSPVQVSRLTELVAVAAGSYHSLAIKGDGTAWAWGDNYFGQLGDGTTDQRTDPVQIGGLTGVVMLAANNTHTVAVKNDGTVWACGDNSHGQLGNNTTIQQLTAVPVSGLSGATKVSAGGYHTVAVKGDGSVWSWGYNLNGQLGDNTTTQRLAPVQVSGLSGVIAVAAGANHTVALKGDGTVRTWGKNTNGQLGDNSTTQRKTPVQVSGLTQVIAVAAGASHTVALKSNGTVWAWGNNWFGQLGDNTTTQRKIPVQVSGLTGVIAVAAGTYHTMALKSDGTVWVWGGNAGGQLGNGSTNESLVPVQVMGLTNATALSAGDGHTLALLNDGTIRGWGDNTYDQLAYPQNRVTQTAIRLAASVVDTDQDAMDDTWENQYFGGLSHLGGTDSDGDGLTDLQEFTKGSNPIHPDIDANLLTDFVDLASNRAPVADPQSVTTDEDAALPVVLSATDADGDTLTYNISVQPLHGTLTGAAPNITYVPAANYHGADSFAFTASDGAATSPAATISLTVTSVNDAPVADPQSVTTDEDAALPVVLSATDADGDALTYNISVQPLHGTLTGAAPNITYVPAANYHGADSFAFTASDGAATSPAATVSLTVTSVNDAPVAADQLVTIAEDGSQSFTLSGTDSDGDTLTYAVTVLPEHGTLSGTAPNLTYTPEANYQGSDSLSFVVNDGALDSLPAQVGFNVGAVNDIPFALAQSYVASAGAPRAIVLTGTDPEGATLTYTVVVQPAHGMLSGTGANLTYTATAGYVGGDTFTFKVNDGASDSAPATISLDVRATNSAPVITSQAPASYQLAAYEGPREFMDLSTWQVVNYPYPVPKAANWIVDNTAHTVRQTQNSDPSILLSPVQVQEGVIEGYISVVPTDTDDDMIGFVFGYQDASHYYLFDWKQAYQDDPVSGIAEVGMTVKVVDSADPILPQDLWKTEDSSGRVRQLYHNSVPFADNLIYRFVLSFRPGEFTISIYHNSQVLAAFTIRDDTFHSGAFGFYNNSQDGTMYEGLRATRLASADYFYPVKAVDANDDPITYSLVQGPAGMSINPVNGILVWPAGSIAAGTYPVVLRVTDSYGAFSEQVYNLAVGRDNLPPSVTAGPDRFAPTTASSVTLTGAVTDDGAPPNATLALAWRQVSGPGTLSFASPNAAVTSASATQPGLYVAELEASDGLRSARDLTEVRVDLHYPSARPDGLVAWWPGNGSTDEVVEGSLRMELIGNVEIGNGHVAQGFNFGSGLSYILVAGSEQTDIANNGSFSAEWWMNPNVTGDKVLFQWREGSGTGLEIAIKSTTSLRVDFGIPGVPADFYDAGNTVIQNSWHHYAVSYDRSLRMLRFYVDGELRQESATGDYDADTKGTLMIGTYNVMDTAFLYKGGLDEISFYNRALTTGEIQGVFAGLTAGKPPMSLTAPQVSAGPEHLAASTSVPLALDGYVNDDGLPQAVQVLWEKVYGPGTVQFDPPGSASTAATFSQAGLYILRLSASDSAVTVSDTVVVTVGGPVGGLAAWWPGNGDPHEVVHGGHDVQFFNGAGYATGKVAQGFNFDGVNDRGQVAPHTDLDLGASPNGFTVEFWARPTRIADQVLFVWTDGTTDGIEFYQNGSTFTAYLKNPGPNSSPTISFSGITANAWTHIALTFDKPNGVARLYKDGVEKAVLSQQSLVNISVRSGLSLYLGTYHGTNFMYQGQLDEISLYTRPLFATEISDIHAAGALGKAPVGTNTAPQVQAGVDVQAFVNLPLTLAGHVADDGLPAPATLTSIWSKVSGPGNVAFVNSALPVTAATFDAPGTYVLRLTASDSELSASNDLVVDVVAPVNIPPEVSLTAPANNASFTAGLPFTFTATATDADGTVVKVEFFEGATKLGERTAPDTAGGSAYSFTVAAGFTVGSRVFTARVTDSGGAEGVSTGATAAFTASGLAPTVALTSPVNGAGFSTGVPVTLRASATASQGTIAKVEFFNGATKLGERTVPDGGSGSVFSYTHSAGFAAGTHVLTARATATTSDAATSAPVTITATAYAGSTVVELIAPAEDARISAPASVTGIVGVASLTSWALDYRLKAAEGAIPAAWTQFSTGTNLVGSPAVGATAAIPGSLGTFDPTSLLNGIYEIRLRATTAALTTYIAGPITLIVEGNMKVGAFTLAFEDLKVPVAGIPITLTRTYDSRDARVGDFGPGWRLAVANIRVQKNRNLGTAWYQTLQSGSGIQFYYVEPVNDRFVTVVMPDGETHRFRAGALVKVRPEDPDNASFAVVADDGLLRFYPVGDTTSTLEPVDAAGELDERFYIHGTGDQDLRTSGESDPFSPTYNPTRFRLTTKDGTTFILDERLGLLEMEDLSGNTLVLNRDGQNRVTSVVSTQAAPGAPVVTSVNIVRDANGRVEYIRDPAGRDLDYLYDASGRLSAFVNREGNITQFRYENAAFPHYLTEILDPRGVTALRSEFDAAGKLVKQIDADGKKTVFTHGIDAPVRFEKITDRLNHETTCYYDDRGNVTLKIDPLGTQTTYSYYPDSDRVKFETDHYNNTKSMAYDSRGNVTVETMGASLTEDPANPATGHTTRTVYNALSAPTQITDPDGRVQTFTYDPITNNLLSHTVGAGGSAPATTTYTYKSDGTLDTITDALGNVTGHAYNYAFSDAAYPGAVKQITVTVTDPTGAAGSDPANAAATMLRVTKTVYDAHENMLAQIATRTVPGVGTEDVITKYLYDSENRLKATIMPDSKVSETRYTSFGQTDSTLLWKSVADYQSGNTALARVTSYGYDNRGNQTSTTYPDGTSESSSFDLEGRREWSQDKLGRRTHFQYDKVGRLRFTLHPDATPADLTNNPYTETVYDLAGRVTDTYDELRHCTTVVYFPDGTPNAGRRKESVQVLSTGNLTTSYQYDNSGNVRFVTDPRGNTVETQYDDQGRPTKVIYPATDEHPATQSGTKYNVLGQRVEITDQEGKVTRYRYDGLGRLFEVRQYLDSATAASDTSFTLPVTHSSLVATRYSYDEMGNQLTQTDARANTTQYRYDSLGRRTSRILPDNATESLQYDGWGNLWKRTDFKGYTTTFLYDTLNRLTEKQADPTHPSLVYSHAPDKISYGYDVAGNRIDATVEKGSTVLYPEEGSTVLYAEDTPVDLRGRREFKDTALGKLTYAYYANNQLKSITSSNTDGVVLGYRYDDANRLAYVDDSSSGTVKTTSYGYNANGSLQTVTTPNTVVHTYGYDSLNRLRTLSVANGATSLHAYEYKLKASGHRQQIIEGTKTTTYTYDDLYRLTNEAVTGDPRGNSGNVAYGLDKVGNRESRTSSVPFVLSVANSFNSRDWLSGDNYDANGNTLTSTFSAVSVPDVYDFEDRLIIRRKADGSTVNLSYDADGIVRQKTVFNASATLISTTGYLTDSQNPTGYAQVMEERINAANGTTVKLYAYGNDLISQSVLQPSAIQPFVSYFSYDGLGSVRELTNESGAITDAYDYDAFGILVYRAGTTDNAYLYRGERFDFDIGQYSLRARFYNQTTGRFWNHDTYEGSSSDPMSLHKYLYANASPLNGSDPTGYVTLNDAILTVWNVGVTAGLWVARVAPAVATTAKVLASVAGYSLSALNIYWFATDDSFKAAILAMPNPAGVLAADAAKLLELGRGMMGLSRAMLGSLSAGGHIGGARDCIACTADYLAANAGGEQSTIEALRRITNGSNVTSRQEAVALIEKFTKLRAGATVSWNRADRGLYAVFKNNHVIFGEVPPAPLKPYLYDFQLGKFYSATDEMAQFADAVAVKFTK
jgi:RHS repeat-associated protein